MSGKNYAIHLWRRGLASTARPPAIRTRPCEMNPRLSASASPMMPELTESTAFTRARTGRVLASRTKRHLRHKGHRGTSAVTSGSFCPVSASDSWPLGILKDKSAAAIDPFQGALRRLRRCSPEMPCPKTTPGSPRPLPPTRSCRRPTGGGGGRAIRAGARAGNFRPASVSSVPFPEEPPYSMAEDAKERTPACSSG